MRSSTRPDAMIRRRTWPEQPTRRWPTAGLNYEQVLQAEVVRLRRRKIWLLFRSVLYGFAYAAAAAFR